MDDPKTTLWQRWHLVFACILMAFFTQPVLAKPLWPGQDHQPTASQVATKPSREDPTQALRWISAPGVNICQGYYFEPDIVWRHRHPLSINQALTSITANQTTFSWQRGLSTLTGDVVVVQPGREVKANQAFVYRDAKTGKIYLIDLKGRVRLRETGKLIVAKHARLELNKHTALFEQVLYRISKPGPLGTLNAWGTAKQATRESTGVLNFLQASYTTCPPKNPTWKIRASRLTLDKKEGRGTAVNSRIYLKGFPIFYFPYFTFPIDKRRKTGFLYPTISYSNESGTDISLPYYINLAPNYDLTLTPRYITRRGFLANALYRYLTSRQSGFFNIGYIPHDKAFKIFQRDALTKRVSSQRALNRLQKAKPERGMLALKNSARYNNNWSTALTINYVTDDYYLQDFGGIPSVINTDQLLNEADLNYIDEHWDLFSRVQTYQTLHPINRTTMDQYSRLPELNLLGNYPNQRYGFDYKLDSQYIFFDHRVGFVSRIPVVTGSRLYLLPGISRPITGNAGYIKPRVQVHFAGYALQNNSIGSNTIHAAVPIVDLDTGLHFERSVQFAGQQYKQTLEPRLYYLYVPTNTAQNNMPNFDTTLPALSLDQMFRPNRFSGYDRIGDANQIAFALTSQFFSSNTGEEKFRASIGQTFLFHKHEICITPDCSDDPNANNRISPVVAELRYFFNKAWNAVTSVAWDTSKRQANNGSFTLQYQPKQNHILNLGYEFVRGGDPLAGTDPASHKNHLDRVDIAFAWPLATRWNVVGDWNYNISHKHPQTYFYGVEYESCCFAVRIVASRTFTGDLGKTFENRYYFQILLKGLGNFGTNDPSSLLADHITGYKNQF